MIGFIISCMLTFELICALEFTASRSPGSSATNADAFGFISIPTRSTGLSETTSSPGRLLTTKQAFQSRNTRIRVEDNQSPQSPKHSSQAASCDQDRKSPRLLLSRLIIVNMNQHSRVNDNERRSVRNSSNAQNNSLDDEKVSFGKPAKSVETNTITKFPDETFDNNMTDQSSTDISKTPQDKSKKESSNTTSVNVTLVDRSSFIGDGCPTGYAKVNGKCVPVSE